jgi:hypothetical protein
LKFLREPNGPTVLFNESMHSRASLAQQLEDQAESLQNHRVLWIRKKQNGHPKRNQKEVSSYEELDVLFEAFTGPGCFCP